jgi:hypothetical protein
LRDGIWIIAHNVEWNSVRSLHTRVKRANFDYDELSNVVAQISALPSKSASGTEKKCELLRNHKKCLKEHLNANGA